MDTTPQNKPYEYFAFISYKREDEKWAKWLQKKLESYSLPTAIRKERPELPNKIRPVFRDQSELSGGNLKAEIEKGLNSSKYLIVICSPRSAKSPWVSKEVQHFIDQGRENYIIPFIIGGTPNALIPEDECFPKGLRQLTGEKEILGININEMGRDAAVIKVIARMLDLRFDTIWQRFERNRQCENRLWISVAIFITFLSISIGVYFIKQSQIIEDKNTQLNIAAIRLREDSVAMSNHIKRIKNISDQLVLKNDSIEWQRDSLFYTNGLITVEKNNVLMETAKTISKHAESLFRDGKILQAYQFIKPTVINIIKNNYPYSVEIASLLNKIKWFLNQSGYKCIDILNASESDDSVYVSPDLLYNPYVEKGNFYLRDIKNQLTYTLPNEYIADQYDFQFSDSILYYSNGINLYYWSTSKNALIYSSEPYLSMFTDYELFLDYVIPNKKELNTVFLQSDDELPKLTNSNYDDIVKEKGYFMISDDANEILISNNLLSKRTLPIVFPGKWVEKRQCSVENENKEFLIVDSVNWNIIHKRGSFKLYKEDDEHNPRLLLKNIVTNSNIIFDPFIAYSLGNGISQFLTAFIINDIEVLCVANQVEHAIYNTKLKTKRYFQLPNIDSWSMSHIGAYIAKAFLLNDNTLCDVRINGQITIYDIPSGLIIDEYDIPAYGWLNDGSFITDVSLCNNKIIMNYDNCIYEINLDDRLKSLKDDITVIDKFFD